MGGLKVLVRCLQVGIWAWPGQAMPQEANDSNDLGFQDWHTVTHSSASFSWNALRSFSVLFCTYRVNISGMGHSTCWPTHARGAVGFADFPHLVFVSFDLVQHPSASSTGTWVCLKLQYPNSHWTRDNGDNPVAYLELGVPHVQTTPYSHVVDCVGCWIFAAVARSFGSRGSEGCAATWAMGKGNPETGQNLATVRVWYIFGCAESS